MSMSKATEFLEKLYANIKKPLPVIFLELRHFFLLKMMLEVYFLYYQ